jgi:SAM-dependent methyltransferase
MGVLRLYTDLAPWWPLLSSPEEYAEEAAFYFKTLVETGVPKGASLLELGSGGGNNASHLKQHFQMTLVDLSPGMLSVSRELNPELEHIQGDMRSVRLEREFDAIFIHDAIVYLTSEKDLLGALNTAYTHCRPGGTALFHPDTTLENFKPGTDMGGHDGPQRAMRYLEWTWDPDPSDCTYLVDFAYLLREADGSVHCEHDRHEFGLFSTSTWLRLIAEAGFLPETRPFVHTEVPPGDLIFLGRKPATV